MKQGPTTCACSGRAVGAPRVRRIAYTAMSKVQSLLAEALFLPSVTISAASYESSDHVCCTFRLAKHVNRLQPHFQCGSTPVLLTAISAAYSLPRFGAIRARKAASTSQAPKNSEFPPRHQLRHTRARASDGAQRGAPAAARCPAPGARHGRQQSGEGSGGGACAASNMAAAAPPKRRQACKLGAQQPPDAGSHAPLDGGRQTAALCADGASLIAHAKQQTALTATCARADSRRRCGGARRRRRSGRCGQRGCGWRGCTACGHPHRAAACCVRCCDRWRCRSCCGRRWCTPRVGRCA